MLTQEPVDLLVVSTACHASINRSVYRLFAKAGTSVVLVVPAQMAFGTGVIPADAPADDDPPIVYLDLRGNHSRLWRLVGITRVLNRHRPKLVLLDNDPASVMAIQIGMCSRSAHSKL